MTKTCMVHVFVCTCHWLLRARSATSSSSAPCAPTVEATRASCRTRWVRPERACARLVPASHLSPHANAPCRSIKADDKAPTHRPGPLPCQCTIHCLPPPPARCRLCRPAAAPTALRLFLPQRRLNVAATRARHGLVVLLHARTLQADPVGGGPLRCTVGLFVQCRQHAGRAGRLGWAWAGVLPAACPCSARLRTCHGHCLLACRLVNHESPSLPVPPLPAPPPPT